MNVVYTAANGVQYKVERTYDANGNIIKEVNIITEEQKMVTEYTYDADGNLIKEIYTDVDGSKKVTETQYVFVYIPYDLSSQTQSLIDSLNVISWAD
jgi:YD repeat-containing protein